MVGARGPREPERTVASFASPSLCETAEASVGYRVRLPPHLLHRAGGRALGMVPGAGSVLRNSEGGELLPRPLASFHPGNLRMREVAR